MNLLVRGVLLLALSLPVAAAAPPFFGDPFPLTNTRYAATPGIPSLASNGNTLVMAWVGDQSVRVKTIGDGDTSNFVLPTFGSTDEVAIVWTGTNFLVAASNSDDGLAIVTGRLLNANGKPIGGAFNIVLNGAAPRLASNGSSVVLLYREDTTDDLYARRLQQDGRPPFGSTAQKVASRAAFGPIYDIATNGSGYMAVASSPVDVSIAMFGADGVLQSTKQISGSQGTSRPRPATIASNGNNYFVAWFDFSRQGLATFVDAAGNALAPITFDEIVSSPTPVFLAPKAVWSGTDWVLAYVHKVQLDQRLRTAHFSPDVRSVTKRETEVAIATGAVGTSSIVRHNNAVRLAWSAERFPERPALVISTLPLALGSGQLVTLDAPDQKLLATAGTSTLAIFLWNESHDRDIVTHLGIGDMGGFYLERTLPVIATSAIASAGNGFLIVTRDGDASVAIRLDVNGTPVGQPVDLPFTATSIAWNGSVWAIAGEDGTAVVAAEMTPNGVLSSAKLVRNNADTPAIASNGTNFLMVWRAEGNCSPPCFPPTIVRGARLDSERNRIDGVDLDFSPTHLAESPSVAWNPDSETYVVAWIDAEEVITKQIPPVGPPGGGNNTIHLALKMQRDLSMLTTAGTVALTWTDDLQTRVAFLNVIGNIAKMFTFSHLAGYASGAPLLVNVPDGDTGVVFDEINPTSPHYGATRVMIALSSPAPVGVPETPHVTATLQSNGTVLATWSSPDQTLNGFRVETRSGNGPWYEVEEFFDRTIRTMTIAPVNREPLSVRVRAFSDEGVSEYSNEATVRFPSDAKRRSVRK